MRHLKHSKNLCAAAKNIKILPKLEPDRQRPRRLFRKLTCINLQPPPWRAAFHGKCSVLIFNYWGLNKAFLKDVRLRRLFHCLAPRCCA